MPAADALVGLGLAPSPYTEAIAELDEARRLARKRSTLFVERGVEVERLRRLLFETLQPGAYGVGSTLAQRISEELGEVVV